MATDFAVFLRRFLTGHLAGLRGYSLPHFRFGPTAT